MYQQNRISNAGTNLHNDDSSIDHNSGVCEKGAWEERNYSVVIDHSIRVHS
jgi:hypothetical protein